MNLANRSSPPCHLITLPRSCSQLHHDHLQPLATMPTDEERDRIEEQDALDSEPKRILHDCGNERTPDLRILHFNDVYRPR